MGSRPGLRQLPRVQQLADFGDLGLHRRLAHHRRIRMLADEGLSPYKISADLAERGVKLSHVTAQDHRRQEGSGMSTFFDRMREEQMKAKIQRHIARRHRELDIADVAEASRRGRLLEGELENSLPDVPLHKRGFGVMDEDAP